VDAKDALKKIESFLIRIKITETKDNIEKGLWTLPIREDPIHPNPKKI
jgi:hypothetical protein